MGVPCVVLRNDDPDGQLGYAQVEYGFDAVVLVELKLDRCDDVDDEKLIGRLDGVDSEQVGVELRLDVDLNDDDMSNCSVELFRLKGE